MESELSVLRAGGGQVYETTYYLRTLIPACSFCRSRSVCHTAPHQRVVQNCREE